MSATSVFPIFIVLFIILPIFGHKSGVPVESGIGVDKMKRCIKQKLDIENPDHLCNNTLQNILSNKLFIPSQTSCILSVFDAFPVQYCVGIAAVNCKRNFFETMISKSHDTFIDYQDKNPTPAMLFYKNGSDSELGIYVFDHQHMTFALAVSENIPQHLKYLKVCLIEDMRKKYRSNEMDLFWDYMIRKGYSYPYDQYYVYRNPIQYMPSSILQLVDDPFRSLATYIQNYMGFIYCPNPEEDVNALNFSKCFGKKGIKWKQKYGDIGLQLIWSEFIYRKLNDSEYVQELYTSSNTLYQMEIFRKLLPTAMRIALNGSDGAKKLPSFNKEPNKVDVNDLILYDDGCDYPLQMQIELINDTKQDVDNVVAMMDKVSGFSLMDKYLIGVCIAGVVAILLELRRYYEKMTQIDEHYGLRNMPINDYGSTFA